MTHTQQWAPPGPGIYSGVPAEVYHRDPVPGGSLSSTGARRLLPPSCPARYRHERDNPPPEPRRLIPAPLRVPADWMPPTPSPAARQTLAPTYYATRRLHAGPNDRTGLLPTISADTRCPR